MKIQMVLKPRTSGCYTRFTALAQRTQFRLFVTWLGPFQKNNIECIHYLQHECNELRQQRFLVLKKSIFFLQLLTLYPPKYENPKLIYYRSKTSYVRFDILSKTFKFFFLKTQFSTSFPEITQ